MSETLRIALVAEGPTDRIFIESALTSILDPRPFVFRQLQPEGSAPFGETGTGWTGVYKWCRSAARRSGRLSDDVTLLQWDLLILHLDADVAANQYKDGNIEETADDLPCERDCPPPSATTEELRKVLLRWCNESGVPARVVLCTPSKSTEAWVVVALFPNDSAVKNGIECLMRPENRLNQQPLKTRIKKRESDYRDRSAAFTEAWPRLAGSLSEAARFDAEMRARVSAVDNAQTKDNPSSSS